MVPACHWPASADTFSEASNTGCTPRSFFQICEVPSGSALHPDGSVTTPPGATAACVNECSPTEFALECLGPAGGAGTIPSPAADLHCRAVPIPTAPNSLRYCCQCSE